MGLGRWMTIARMNDGRLVVHSAVALPEDQMARIDEWGEVAFIVVPNRFHRLDAAAFAERYPEAKVVCPAGAKAKVEAVVPVDLGYDEFEGDDVVSIDYVAGLKESEGVMRVRDAEGVTLVFTDLLFNKKHGKGFGGLIMRMIGSSGGPKVTPLFRMMALKDKPALREALLGLAETEGLVRLVPGHGRIIDDDPAGTLRSVAERL